MTDQASALLGGDTIITSNRPIPDSWIKFAQLNKLAQSMSINFLSVVSKSENFALSSIKAVNQNYPLKGKIKVSTELFSVGNETNSIPEPGTVWLESRLLSQLGVNLGEAITLGKSKFIVSKIISFEPDRAGQWLVLAPRVLLNEIDLEKTGLLQVGSRVSYTFLLAGSVENINQFSSWVKPKLGVGQRVITVNDERRGLSNTLKERIAI